MMLFCLASISTLVSCSKDNEDLIVGKWQYVRELPTKGFGLNDCEIIEFNAGGTGAWYDDEGFGMPCTWTINGDILLFYYTSCRIEELSKNKLVLTEIDLEDGHVYRTREFKRLK